MLKMSSFLGSKEVQHWVPMKVLLIRKVRPLQKNQSLHHFIPALLAKAYYFVKYIHEKINLSLQ